MSKKIKKYLPAVVGIGLASAVVAGVEPVNTIVYFLPKEDYGKIDSVRESVSEPTRSGALKSHSVLNLPSEFNQTPNETGIVTPSRGVSLYDKPTDWTNDKAAENVLSPAKVLILPPENLANKTAHKKNYKSGEVNPVGVRIYPMVQPIKQIVEENKQQPIYAEVLPEPPAPEKNEGRPKKMEEWTGWILDKLKQCDGSKRTVLPTLYWMMANNQLTNGQSVCSMKAAVADYLRLCHPYPVVYYTPTNNDVPANEKVQMATDILLTGFDNSRCEPLNLTHINFEKIEFASGALIGANFSDSFFKEAYFLNVNLIDSVFKNAKIENALFSSVDLTRSYLKDVKMTFSHFHRVYAPMTNFNQADLTNTQFRDVVFKFSSFVDAKMANTAWQDVLAFRANLTNADLRQAAFDNVMLDGSVAVRSNFSLLSCKSCLFKQANMEYANFDNSYFDNVSFKSAKANYANFVDAVFNGNAIFNQADLYEANFKNVDMRALSDIPLTKLRLLAINKNTRAPENYPDFEAADYDQEIYKRTNRQDHFVCSKNACDAVALGRDNGQNLAVRAMTILANPPKDMNDRLWAICTVGCIANKDKKLENSIVDTLAAYVRNRRKWSAETDLFKPISPVEEDVDLALRLLTDPTLERSVNGHIDLSNTDLRMMDFSGTNLNNVNFAGSYLGGTNFTNAKLNNEYHNFDRAVIDEFTRMPDYMGTFKQFQLPDAEFPDWWKPETVHVLQHGSHPWNKITVDVPFIDDYIVSQSGANAK